MTNEQNFPGNGQVAGVSEPVRWLRILLARALLCCGVAFAGLASAETGAGIVNINNADAETLAEVLDGVGLSRAQAKNLSRRRKPSRISNRNPSSWRSRHPLSLRSPLPRSRPRPKRLRR